MKEHLPIITEDSAHVDQENRPRHGADDGEDDEFPHRELSDAGGKRDESTDAGKKSSGEYGHRAVSIKPALRCHHLFRCDAALGRVFQEQVAAAFVAHVVREHGPH